MKNLFFAVLLLLIGFSSCDKKPKEIQIDTIVVKVYPEGTYDLDNPDLYLVVKQNEAVIHETDVKLNASRFDQHTFDVYSYLIDVDGDVTVELWDEDLNNDDFIGSCTRSFSGYDDVSNSIGCSSNGFSYSANLTYVY